MGKRIISCVIAFCLILSGITFESREEIKAAVTVTESHLYSVCPAYLNNETANNREAIARNAISKALSQISAADEFCAAYVLGLQKGEKILLNSFLSTCGISESMYDQKVDDAVTLLMDKFLCRNKNASEEAKSISTKYNKYLKKAFDLYDATSREEYISALQEANDKLDADAARDIVDEIMKDSSLKEIKKYVGDGIELWYLAANFVELQEIELETVDELISICVSNTATCGTDLHEGLLRYREEITNNIGEYFANNWLKDKIIEKVYNSIKKAGTKDFLSLPSSEKLAASLMVEVVAWAYEQNHPSANQIIEALIFQNFVISSGNAVNAVWYNLRLADSENYNKDTLKKQYILAHDLYYTAIQCSLNTAKKCTQDQGWKDVCSKYENAFRNTWTYSEYISLCLKDAQDDVNNGILVISTSNSTTTASGGKQSTNDNYLESIQAKFNEVKAHYPVESTWNGNWAGAIQCFGFARMVFSKLYGCEMSYRYKASAKYEYDDLTNVVMKGQLTGSNVTVENLKTLMAQGQLGDIVQAAGSSASQHTMVFEACTDSGILVYDCNSHLSGHNDADCTIHEWTIPWSSLVSWYGSGGISLYHAKNYESIYGDGSGLFYDDTVNFVIDENGILTKYNGWQSFVEIPDTVTSIGDSAFKGNKTMVSVTIPDSVKSIGNYAFENCTALAAAVIPDSVENIGNSAFSGCSSMETVKLPQNRKYINISTGCFRNCAQLKDVEFPDRIEKINSDAFRNCENIENINLPNNLISLGSESFGNCNKITKIKIPKSLESGGQNSITSRGKGAFSACENLKEIEFEEGTTKIAYKLFDSCTGLEEISLPEGLTSIDAEAFYGCINLKRVGLPEGVTSIGNDAFYGCDSIETIDLPKTLTKIGSSAFYECDNLKTITISENVTEIGDCAFKYCKNLETVKLSSALTKLGSESFGNCNRITKIKIPKSLESGGQNYFTSRGKGAFSACENLKEIEFEEGTTKIAYKLFDSCTGLEEISLPEGITSIDAEAFYGCINLKKVGLPEGVTSIGNDAFYGCDSIETIDLPKTLTKIGSSAFYECDNLKTITISENVTEIGDCAFKYCKNLETVKLSSALTKLGSESFGSCNKITKIKIPKSLESGGQNYFTSRGKGAFSACENLKEIEFEEGTTKIAYKLFDSCTGLEEISLPEGITSIDAEAFYGCINLKKVGLPEGVTSIGNNAFYGCESIETVDLPDTLTKIEYNAFAECSSLVEINIPNTVTEMGTSIFSGCTSLITVHLPEIRQNIMQHMFYNCKKLKNINFPSTLTTIQNNAFYGCEELEQVILSEGLTSIEYNAFYNCKALQKVTIPDSIKTIGNNAFNGCEALNDITLGANLTKIESSTFANCSSLQSIIIPRNVTSIGDKAFENNIKLTSVSIPRKTTSIASNAFSYPAKMTIYGVTGTYAQTYASDKGINFVAQDVPATSIVLNESSLTLNKYNSAQLEATIAPANFTDEVVWSSSDTNVATVDQTGYVYAKQGGVTTITATAGNVSASCVVTVDQKISSIYFDDYSVSINIGEQKQLSVQIYPYDATNKDIEYKSLNENIATVNSNGVVTGIAEGTAEIKAIAKDGSEKWDSCYVYVSSSYSDDDNYEDNDHDDNYDDNMNNDNSNSGNESNNDNSSNNTSNTDSSNNSEGSATIRLEDCIAELSATVFTYDGTEKCPVVTIKNGSTLLVQNIDYTVQYTNNINVGTATVIVVGKGRYTGTVLLNYSIVASTSDANSSTNVPKKGTKLVDPKYKLVYKITNSNKVKPKVEFIGTNNKKAKNISVSNTVKINGITYIVESVGAGALKNNKTVTSITIGNNVTKIKNDAFRGCTKLSKITIGKNVISLGNNVFYGCKKLSKIKINSTKMTAKTLSSKAFAGINKNTIIDVPNSKIKSYKTLFAKKGLPKNVKIK